MTPCDRAPHRGGYPFIAMFAAALAVVRQPGRSRGRPSSSTRSAARTAPRRSPDGSGRRRRLLGRRSEVARLARARCPAWTPPAPSRPSLFTGGADGVSRTLVYCWRPTASSMASPGGRYLLWHHLRLDPASGALTTLHTFDGGNGRWGPLGTLIEAADGNSTHTEIGGTGQQRPHVPLHAQWDIQHHPRVRRGISRPWAPLLQAPDGSFYGRPPIRRSGSASTPSAPSGPSSASTTWWRAKRCSVRSCRAPDDTFYQHHLRGGTGNGTSTASTRRA